MQLLDLAYAAVHHSPLPSLPSANERRTIREKAGVSQLDLSAAVGVERATLSRWESSDSAPRLANDDLRYRRTLAALSEYSGYLEELSAKAAGRVAVAA